MCNASAPTGCTHCYDGRCMVGGGCGAPCSNTLDCDQSGNCRKCGDKGVCVLHCGQECFSDVDCQMSHCQMCVRPNSGPGQCVAAVCPAHRRCNTTDTCLTQCAYCDIAPGANDGTCRTRCGSECFNDMDCPAPCPNCVNRACQTG